MSLRRFRNVIYASTYSFLSIGTSPAILDFGSRAWVRFGPAPPYIRYIKSDRTSPCSHRLRFVSERADVLECFGHATIPERPGAFWDLYSTIFPRNVTEFSYRMISPEVSGYLLSFKANPSSRLI
jgi:hypothetical protein